MKKILEFLKSLFKPKSNTTLVSNIDSFNQEKEEAINKLLTDINIGDVIWAKRYSNESSKLRIPEGHREGPFIVLGKCEKGLICSYGSSAGRTKYNVIFGPDKYGLSKKTYFSLASLEIIDNKAFLRKMGALEENNLEFFLNELKRKIKSYKYIDRRFVFNLSKEVGDVILYGDNIYMILDIADGKLSCVKLNLKFKDYDRNLSFEYFNNLDYSRLLSLNKNSNAIYLATANSNILSYTLNECKKYLEHIKTMNVIQRGSVVKKEDNLYYINGEEGKDFLGFAIYYMRSYKSDTIIINGKKFYTCYNDIRIDKKEPLSAIDLATEKEIDNIKSQKKSYKKTYKSIASKANVIVGDIIKENSSNNRFVVIGLLKNSCCCISYNSLNEVIPKKYYFNLNNVVRIGGLSYGEIKEMRKNSKFVISTENKRKMKKKEK